MFIEDSSENNNIRFLCLQSSAGLSAVLLLILA